MLNFLKMQKKQTDDSASVHRRFLAFTFDNILLLFIRYIILLLLFFIWFKKRFLDLQHLYWQEIKLHGQEIFDYIEFFAIHDIWRDLFIISIIMLIPGAIYHIYMLSHKWQATIGKRIFSVFITNEEGKKLSLKHSATRYFVSLLPWAMNILVIIGIMNHDIKMILLAAIIVAFWYDTSFLKSRKRTIHDIICKTLAKKGRIV